MFCMDGPGTEVEQTTLAASRWEEGLCTDLQQKVVGTTGPGLLADGPAELMSWASGATAHILPCLQTDSPACR